MKIRNTIIGAAAALLLSSSMITGTVFAESTAETAAESTAESMAETAAESMAENAEGYVLATNTKVPDFTVETQNGTFTLSEELKTHDMVLLNFWATWCPPCQEELPYLQEITETRDDVSVLLVSTEPGDTMEKIKGFAEDHGYTIPYTAGAGEVAAWYPSVYIPGTAIIDRTGTVTYLKENKFINAASVNRLLDEFAGEDYTTHVVEEIPKPKITAEAESQEELEAVLGSGFTFETAEGDWPMVLDGEENAVCSSNVEMNTKASLDAAFTADGAAAFDVKIEGGPLDSILDVYLDGELVKSFTACDWKTCTIPAEGEHTIRIEFLKRAEGDSRAKLANFRLLKADEVTEDASYPVSEETEIEFAAPAKKVVFNVEELAEMLGVKSIWVAGSDELEAFIRPADDPDAAFFVGSGDGEITALSGLEITEKGFVQRMPFEAIEGTPYEVFYYVGRDMSHMDLIMVFRDGEDLETLLGMKEGSEFHYEMTDSATESAALAEPAEEPADSAETVKD